MAMRPGEFTLTGWLDPVFDYFAKQADIPTADYTAVAGAEGIGASIEFITDLFTKGLLNKAINFLVAITSAGYGIWGKPTPQRLRRELITLGQHALTRVVDMKPSDALELRQSLDTLVEGLRLGDSSRVAEALLRTPEELRQMLAALGAPVSPTPPELPSTPGTPPLVRPTLEGAPPAAPFPAPPAPPLPPAAPLFRATSDSFQPPAPSVAKRLFRETLS
jgi:hypothetical protein